MTITAPYTPRPELIERITQLNDSTFPVPSTMYLKPEDDAGWILEQLQDKITNDLAAFTQDAFESFYSRETRYDEANPPPESIVFITSPHTRHTGRIYLTLPNGQRVRKLDDQPYPDFRVRTLCGLLQSFPYHEALSALRAPASDRRTKCPHCLGNHLPSRQTPSPSSPSSPRLSSQECCAKCGHSSTGLTHYQDYTHCVICGYRDYQPIPQLTEEELQENYERISAFLGDFTWDQPSITSESFAELNPSHIEFPDMLTKDSVHDGTSHQMTSEENGSSLHMHEEETEGLETWVPHGWHIEDTIDQEDVRQWALEIEETIHRPALKFYRARSPFRQRLVEAAILDDMRDPRYTGLMVAGQHLYPQHADIKGHTPLHHHQQMTVAEWMLTLPDTDITFFATHPEDCLHQVSIGMYENPTRLLLPLIQEIEHYLSYSQTNYLDVHGAAMKYRVSPDIVRFIINRPYPTTTDFAFYQLQHPHTLERPLRKAS